MRMSPSAMQHLRYSLGYTIKHCADDMGLSAKTLADVESGKNTRYANRYYYELYLKERKRQRVYAEMRREASKEDDW